jgi:hypothetical protein
LLAVEVKVRSINATFVVYASSVAARAGSVLVSLTPRAVSSEAEERSIRVVRRALESLCGQFRPSGYLFSAIMDGW